MQRRKAKGCVKFTQPFALLSLLYCLIFSPVCRQGDYDFLDLLGRTTRREELGATERDFAFR
jgi:hypothetical protein